MTIRKGMKVRTKSGTWWNVEQTQDTDKYLTVVSGDGFETIVDINLVDLFR